MMRNRKGNSFTEIWYVSIFKLIYQYLVGVRKFVTLIFHKLLHCGCRYIVSLEYWSGQTFDKIIVESLLLQLYLESASNIFSLEVDDSPLDPQIMLKISFNIWKCVVFFYKLKTHAVKRASVFEFCAWLLFDWHYSGMRIIPEHY
jgi:hypothetical protein